MLRSLWLPAPLVNVMAFVAVDTPLCPAVMPVCGETALPPVRRIAEFAGAAETRPLAAVAGEPEPVMLWIAQPGWGRASDDMIDPIRVAAWQ